MHAILLIMLMFRSGGIASSAPTAAQIQSMLAGEGAQAAVRELWGTPPRWDAVLRQVEAGESEWLKIAVDLKQGTDAGSGETLRQAVSESIQRRPKNFLLIAWPAFGSSACHDLSIEPSTSAHKAFLVDTKKALLAVNEPGLQAARNACLAALAN